MNQGDGKILILHPMIQGVDEVKEFFAVMPVTRLSTPQGTQAVR